MDVLSGFATPRCLVAPPTMPSPPDAEVALIPSPTTGAMGFCIGLAGGDLPLWGSMHLGVVQYLLSGATTPTTPTARVAVSAKRSEGQGSIGPSRSLPNACAAPCSAGGTPTGDRRQNRSISLDGSNTPASSRRDRSSLRSSSSTAVRFPSLLCMSTSSALTRSTALRCRSLVTRVYRHPVR